MQAGKKAFQTVDAYAIAVTFLAFALVAWSHGQSQTSAPARQWEQEAGGHQSFEVASVRPSPLGSHRRDNIDLGPMDSFSLPGGLFSTNVSLDSYIIFAYKIADASQYGQLGDQLPKWAKYPAMFDVEARADGHPSKDQLRLMMQGLLADRFKFAMHNETKQLPVYALVLDVPGKLGAGLSTHPADRECPAVPTEPSRRLEPPPICGLIQTWTEGGLFHLRMMNVSMETIAGTLVPFLGRMGGFKDRPTIDRTGLQGKYDFTLAFLPETLKKDDAEDGMVANGPGLRKAIEDQLGLKLVEQKGPVSTYAIDHLQIPSEN